MFPSSIGGERQAFTLRSSSIAYGTSNLGFAACLGRREKEKEKNKR